MRLFRMYRSNFTELLTGILLVGIMCSAVVGLAVNRAKAAPAIAQTIAASSDATTSGSIVSMQASSAPRVELATPANSSNLVGVVQSNALVALDNSQQGVHVVINGTTPTFVSDVNGVIHAGDRIAISPLSGVGMKALVSGQVVGTAAADFDLSTAKAQTVTDRNGGSRTVHIELLPVQVAVTYYVSPTSTFLPPFLQNFAQTVAGKPVSALRVLIASGLTLIGVISVVALIYSAVRSAILSIGRNPLASKEIRRGLSGITIIVVLLIIFTGLVADIILTF